MATIDGERNLEEPATEQAVTASLHEPSILAEDDAFRSCYVQKIVQNFVPESVITQPNETSIPKVIVQFWHDSNNIPVDVQNCLDSWVCLEEQGFKRLLFDDQTAKNFISRKLGSRYSKAFEFCYHPAMRCDYFRLCYILIHGGFYVDADEVYLGTECTRFFFDRRLKVQPLCYDANSGNMVSPDLFIKRDQSSPSWIFYFNNNPIISPACHPIVKLALERATNILLGCSEQPEIQSTTGPGNFTASLVVHALSHRFPNRRFDFMILPDWETISISVWPLSYRDDDRNWRLFNSERL